MVYKKSDNLASAEKQIKSNTEDINKLKIKRDKYFNYSEYFLCIGSLFTLISLLSDTIMNMSINPMYLLNSLLLLGFMLYIRLTKEFTKVYDKVDSAEIKTVFLNLKVAEIYDYLNQERNSG